MVNGKQIAKGEVVVVDGNFAFRITEIESAAQRLQSLS
jgi:flagellar motor switch protein FliN/FliY